ncbi:trypsin-like peptidase domain-containing protein [Streptomyces ziwulingensis]|uniref:Trypsin-like peptidase domain-containing protein n=1 Tax=Streptomyces ziwulingensis TaxID=1045501 RepID=A0ABP9CT85_9ACTN
MAATVRIHRPATGYALDEPGTFLGSGFFVAPNWVLTCAHVVGGGEGGEVAVVYEPAPGRGMSAVTGTVRAALPDGAGATAPGNWPAPDLALVQLDEPVDHECGYVSERPAAYFGEGKVLYAGWTVVDGRLRFLDGTLTVQGTIGGWSSDVQMRLGENDLPYGVSGGPVIDPLRGEVIGVLKSRSDHTRGGTSTGLEQLRTLPVPTEALTAEHDDLYHSVTQAHDRYHRDRQRHPEARRHTWVDVQSQLGARPGRTLSPDERVQLLGRLADLPPPASTHSLLDILDSLAEFQAPLPQAAPRGWRDGLGALYESARDDGALDLVLNYAVRVLCAERPFTTPGTTAAEQALWDWVWQAAQRLGYRRRSALAGQRADGLRQRRTSAPTGAQAGAQAGAGAGALQPSPQSAPQSSPRSAPQPSVLVELVQRGWERERCDWSVSVLPPGGEAIRLEEGDRTPVAELATHLAAPLAEAFRRCDEPGRPAVLQVALPHPLLELEAEDWQLGPREQPLGVERPVVLRCLDRDQIPEDDETELFDADPFDLEEERRARWRWLHAHRAKAEVLDCDEGLRKPVPSLEQLRGLSHGAVPVLCRFGEHRYESDAVALARIVRGGFGVALWRRRGGAPDAVCGEFHRGTLDEIADPPSAHRLPEAVHALRANLRAGRQEAFWADGIALLYDDPHQPLPGSGDLLEAP